jgi:hypothetical protein
VPAALLLTLLALLTPRLLRVRTTLLPRRALTPAALLSRLTLRLAWPRSPRLRRTLLRPLAPTALLRRLPLLGRLTLRGLTLRGLGLLRALAPAATTLAGRLLSPAAALLWRLPSLSPLLPAWLAPRLPRTPRSLRRRRHIRSF